MRICLVECFPKTSGKGVLGLSLSHHAIGNCVCIFDKPFFFLLGPFVLTNVVTCKTNGSSVFSTDIVRISKFFGSHFSDSVPKSPIVPIVLRYRCLYWLVHFLPRVFVFGSWNSFSTFEQVLRLFDGKPQIHTKTTFHCLISIVFAVYRMHIYTQKQLRFAWR